MTDVKVFPDLQALTRTVAQTVVDRISPIAKRGARFYLALSGGHTPGELYRWLASHYRDKVPWARVHLFWGDERYVPPGDARSNYRMVRESLLDHIPIPEKNVHPMPTDYPRPEDAATAYERTLQNYFPTAWPHFDLVLLGLGADGHTASLFPGSPAVDEKQRWVVATNSSVEPRSRLTLTLPALTKSAQIYFLVAGADKAVALERALADPPDPSSCPASGVRLSQNPVVWWADAAAAARLQKPAQSKAAEN